MHVAGGGKTHKMKTAAWLRDRERGEGITLNYFPTALSPIGSRTFFLEASTSTRSWEVRGHQGMVEHFKS
jgi:hypothetical protein